MTPKKITVASKKCHVDFFKNKNLKFFNASIISTGMTPKGSILKLIFTIEKRVRSKEI